MSRVQRAVGVAKRGTLDLARPSSVLLLDTSVGGSLSGTCCTAPRGRASVGPVKGPHERPARVHVDLGGNNPDTPIPLRQEVWVVRDWRHELAIDVRSHFGVQPHMAELPATPLAFSPPQVASCQLFQDCGSLFSFLASTGAAVSGTELSSCSTLRQLV